LRQCDLRGVMIAQTARFCDQLRRKAIAPQHLFAEAYTPLLLAVPLYTTIAR
jgi:hypothetical protein